MAKKLVKERRQSYGTLNLVEQSDGSLAPQFDITETDGVDPRLVTRIKYALAGLAYKYQRESDDIETIGKAFIEGIELGIDMSDSDEDEPKIGFNAKIKDKT